MAKLIVLGASNAVSSSNSDNTHMVLVGDKRKVLIDCVSNPIHRLSALGIDFNEVTDLILTHFHPDHVSGVPLFLMDMWLRGRKSLINVHGLHYTLDRIERLMGFYSWSEWPGFFPVAFHRLPMSEFIPVITCDEFSVQASPVHHMIPTIGLRFDFTESRKSLVYSCDTEPCEAVVALAGGVDILIHEASGAMRGHSSAAQAGEVAAKAEVGRLYLIHYPTGEFANGDLIEEARQHFRGEVGLAKDYVTFEF